MFDATGAFAKQFEPHLEGYIFFPGRKSGGKLVTETEYQKLLSDWRSIAGGRGSWISAGLVMAFIATGMAIKEIFGAGEWLEQITIFAAVALVLTRIFWASFAPRRLVRGRPDIVPPRSLDASKKLARSMLPWRMIVPVLAISSAVFVASLSSKPSTWGGWLWLAGSGAMTAAYVLIAIQKWRDRPS